MTAVELDDTTAEEVASFDDQTRALLAELDEIGDYLDAVDAKYDRRTEIICALRTGDTVVKQRIIAKYAHTTEGAITQALRKAGC